VTIGMVVVTAATALIVPTGVTIMMSIDLPVPQYVLIPSGIVGALLGSLTSTYRGVHERRQITESQLNATVEALELSVSRLRQEAWIGRRRASYILHGSMQSALYAAILRLSSHPHPDLALISGIRSDISKATAKLDNMAEPSAALRDGLAETADLWSDACDVRWTLSADAERLVGTRSTSAECVAEIVREGVGNAVRHGGAASVTVAVDAGVDRLLIVIDDDGRADACHGEPGLGARMLDEMCVLWTRESTDHGTRLEAELAV
jgi:anti-sigma regulatory factor (Ser/Thr protein kinase)